MKIDRKIILMVEDEQPIRDMIRFSICREFKVIDAKDVTEAMRKINRTIPDLILLDWMLPDKSGIDFIKDLKNCAMTREIPIIMLTAKAEETNKIKGLETGADDYITKPFSPRELIVRIKAVLRRGGLATPDDLVYMHELCIDKKSHVVTIKNQKLELTTLEYKLLEFFISHKNKVYSRDYLLDYIWGRTTDTENRTVDVQIRRLRKKLEKFGYDKFLQTVRGAGYKFFDKG